MSRLESAAAAHFYKISPEISNIITRFIAAPHGGRLLDPCAGKGAALVQLADVWGVEPFGVELHPERAAAAKSLVDAHITSRPTLLHHDRHVTRIFAGSMQFMNITGSSFSCAFVNPPFDYDEQDKRREVRFFSKATGWLQTNGILIFVIPQQILRLKRIAEPLLSWYADLRVFAFPAEHRRFGEVVIFGRKRSRRQALFDDAKLKQFQALHAAELTPIDEADVVVYELPRIHVPTTQLTFLPQTLTSADILSEVQQHGITTLPAYQRLITAPPNLLHDFRPLMPLRKGHLANLIAAGFLNNQRIEREGELPLLIKGLTFKNTRTREYHEQKGEDTQKVTELTESFNTVINTLAPDGTIVRLKGDALRKFLVDHIGQLTKIIERLYPPVYQFDLNGYGDIIATLNPNRSVPNAKAKGLLPAQQHTVAANAMRLDDRYLGQKETYVNGEMGCGKSIIGAAICRCIGAKRIILVCPPHLVSKWQREIVHTIPTARTMVLKRPSDVERFFAAAVSAEKPLFGIMKDTTMSLGETWVHSYDWCGSVVQQKRDKRGRIKARYQSQLVNAFVENFRAYQDDLERPIELTRHRKWQAGQQSSSKIAISIPFAKLAKYLLEMRTPRCPVTGRRLMTLEGYAMPKDFQKRIWWGNSTEPCATFVRLNQRHGSWPTGNIQAGLRRLGAIQRDIRAGKHPYASVSPSRPERARWPLAEYITRRYKGRADVYLSDEIQRQKGRSERGRCHGLMIAACKKHIALTGTLFGGKASTLFLLLYRSSADIRHHYGYHDESRWVDEYGILQETIAETIDEDSGTGKGKRNSTVKELPGAAPHLVRWLLDRTSFLMLDDMGYALPSYKEVAHPVQMAPAMQVQYDYLEATLKEAIGQMLAVGDRSLLAAYVMALLKWPDSPWRGKRVIHKRTGSVVAEIAGLPHWPVGKAPKEAAILAQIQNSIRRGKHVLLLTTQTDTLDITRQWKELLEQHHIRAAILKVAPDKREAWLQRQVENGVQVIISHPKRIETGLDLIHHTIVIWIDQSWSVYTTKQVNRRPYRLIQTQDVEVHFWYYKNSLQSYLLRWLAAKLAMTDRIDGNDIAADSLAEMDTLAQSDVIAYLSKAIQNKDALADINSLQQAFADANQQVATNVGFINGYDIQQNGISTVVSSDLLVESKPAMQLTVTLPPDAKPSNLLHMLKLFKG